jgi:hypothetical protein
VLSSIVISPHQNVSKFNKIGTVRQSRINRMVNIVLTAPYKY